MGQTSDYYWVVEIQQVNSYEDWTEDLRVTANNQNLIKNWFLKKILEKIYGWKQRRDPVDNLDPQRVIEIISGKEVSLSNLYPLPTNTLCGVKGLVQKMFIFEEFKI